MKTQPSALVIFGCGYLGREVARQAAGRYPSIVATVRDPEHAVALAPLGVVAHALPILSAEAAAALVPAGAHVVIAYPPDGLDADRAARLGHAASIVYISTTGVYGRARGRVDEETPLDRGSPRAAERIEAEEAWRSVGAIALRAAGIYGPGRGLHLRIARGDFRVPGDGSQFVSRIHVEDLAAAVLAALDRGPRGAAYVAADATPVPQVEAIRWLCDRLGRPLPPSVPLDEAPETLRGDRAADSSRMRRELGLTLRHPSYREGFAHCLNTDGA